MEAHAAIHQALLHHARLQGSIRHECPDTAMSALCKIGGWYQEDIRSYAFWQDYKRSKYTIETIFLQFIDLKC